MRIGAAGADSSRRKLKDQWRDRHGGRYRVRLAHLEAFQREAIAEVAHTSLVLIFPLGAELSAHARGDRFWSGLMQDLDQRGIPYVDPSPPLRDRFLGERRNGGAGLYCGMRPSRAGNAVVARAVPARLAARYPGLPELAEAQRWTWTHGFADGGAPALAPYSRTGNCGCASSRNSASARSRACGGSSA